MINCGTRMTCDSSSGSPLMHATNMSTSSLDGIIDGLLQRRQKRLRGCRVLGPVVPHDRQVFPHCEAAFVRRPDCADRGQMGRAHDRCGRRAQGEQALRGRIPSLAGQVPLDDEGFLEGDSCGGKAIAVAGEALGLQRDLRWRTDVGNTAESPLYRVADELLETRTGIHLDVRVLSAREGAAVRDKRYMRRHEMCHAPVAQAHSAQDNAVYETTPDPAYVDALFNDAVRCRGRDQEVEAARGDAITQARNELEKKRVREVTRGRRQDIADHVGTVASQLARRAAGYVLHLSGSAENARASRCRYIVVPAERA